MTDEILKETEVTNRYKFSGPWLKRARREGRGPAFLRLGNRMIRYRASDIEKYLEAQTVRPSIERSG